VNTAIDEESVRTLSLSLSLTGIWRTTDVELRSNNCAIFREQFCYQATKFASQNLDFTADESCELERVAGTREEATTTTALALVVGRAVGRSFVISITRV
jgi:hypothetical protein